MPVISLGGTTNTAAQIVPDLYVNIIPPSIQTINGVPTNVGGFVGTASFGPVNQPVLVGTYGQYAYNFGPIVARKYDMGTHVATAILQGANNIYCVRVTDGTDVKATSVGVATCISYALNYSGSLGNQLTIQRTAGSKVGSFRLIVSMPGQTSEIFDNIGGTGVTGNAYWLAEAAALNSGNGYRSMSFYVNATAGAGTTTPTAATYTFSGGTDGSTLSSSSALIGVDNSPGSGMYALRGQGVNVAVVCDDDTSTDWTTVDALAGQEGFLAVQVLPAGITLAAAATSKSGAGMDTWTSTMLHGDWIYWNDPVAQVNRLVSPQGFYAGRVLNLAPNQSPGNKPIYGITGTQQLGSPSSNAQNRYNNAELQSAVLAGLEVLTNPLPQGSIFGARVGHNASSNASINGINYTRMTFFLAQTLAAGMGIYVQAPITPDLLNSITATLNNFLAIVQFQGLLSPLADGTPPFSVVCNATNNNANTNALNEVIANVNVRYQGINEKFNINLQGGVGVSITAASSGVTVSNLVSL
jgi:phage tail sheath protein FI